LARQIPFVYPFVSILLVASSEGDFCGSAGTGSLTAEDHVREVLGVWIRGGTDPNRITIEASEFAAAEIERRFGSVLLIEPELRADH
jgi:hypothetical protein